jgi:hypothetical protein
MAELIETAPKDRRILAFGRCAGEDEKGWATVKWCGVYSEWWVDPTDATEFEPQPCRLTHWMPLPEDPMKEEEAMGLPFHA